MPRLSVRTGAFDQGVPKLAVENVGAGPAFNAAVIAWVLPLAPRSLGTMAEVHQAALDFLATLDEERPHFVYTSPIIGSNREPGLMHLQPTSHAPVEARSVDGGLWLIASTCWTLWTRKSTTLR